MEKRILEIINNILKKGRKDPISNLKGDLDLRNDIGFDSLDLAELTATIEAEFYVDIFEDGLVHTVSDVLAKISP